MTKIIEYDGREEWMCFSCGRHVILTWEPEFKATVLVQGDSSLQHAGLKKHTPVTTGRDEPPFLIKNPRLKPWLEWMNKIGFEDLWDGETP